MPAKSLQSCPTVRPCGQARQAPLSMGFSTEIRSPIQGIFPTQGSNPCLLRLLHCRRILYRRTSWEARTEFTVSNFDVNYMGEVYPF